jgi:hypothetical protein
VVAGGRGGAGADCSLVGGELEVVASGIDVGSTLGGAEVGVGGGDSFSGGVSSDGRGGWFGGTVTRNSPLQLA